jgi:predicted Zn-dependent protease
MTIGFAPYSYTTPNQLSSTPPSTSDAADTSSQTERSGRKKRGSAYHADLWPQHSTVKISFIGMTEEQKEFTKAQIAKWAEHVNLKFEYTDDADADIRIAADNNTSGGKSFIGRQAQDIPKHLPTMTIGFAGENSESTAGTVLHEFGHALGLNHEHQHPDNPLVFNEQRTYEEFRRRGLTDEQIKLFVTKPLSRENLIFLGYDPDSIMQYGFGEGTIRNHGPIKQPNELSPGDIEFAKFIYPK